MTDPIAITPAIIISGGEGKPVSSDAVAEFGARMLGPDGLWINLHDGERYIVGAQSMASSATTWRRNQVASPYVAGKFTVSAVPDQVVEQVQVYVLGIGQADLQANLAALIDAVSQPYFPFVWTIDEASYTWDCDAADYAVEYTTATLLARRISVKLSIPRRPLLTMGANP